MDPALILEGQVIDLVETVFGGNDSGSPSFEVEVGSRYDHTVGTMDGFHHVIVRERQVCDLDVRGSARQTGITASEHASGEVDVVGMTVDEDGCVSLDHRLCERKVLSAELTDVTSTVDRTGDGDGLSAGHGECG